jgi:uncharacterized protein YebE (UPF0316 family)
MELPLMLSGVFIFFARVVDMSLATFRILMLMRGQSLLASMIGFLESGIYILALGQVMQHLDNPFNMVLFAAGFAVGNYVGSNIEERIALGYVNLQVISMDCSEALQLRLREEGFGVTAVEGSGKDGRHYILNVLSKRRDLPKLMHTVNCTDEKAFTSVVDTRQIIGGFFPQRKSK